MANAFYINFDGSSIEIATVIVMARKHFTKMLQLYNIHEPVVSRVLQTTILYLN